MVLVEKCATGDATRGNPSKGLFPLAQIFQEKSARPLSRRMGGGCNIERERVLCVFEGSWP